MTRTVHATVRELEELLAAEFRKDGYTVTDIGGTIFARVTGLDQAGEVDFRDVNLSRLATAIERKLS